MELGRFILIGQTPVPCEDLMEWARWLEEADRTVARTYLGKILISTVFLGTDHNFEFQGAPVLFETMVFGGHQDGYQRRYETWEEAEQGHWQVVRLLERMR